MQDALLKADNFQIISNFCKEMLVELKINEAGIC